MTLALPPAPPQTGLAIAIAQIKAQPGIHPAVLPLTLSEAVYGHAFVNVLPSTSIPPVPQRDDTVHVIACPYHPGDPDCYAVILRVHKDGSFTVQEAEEDGSLFSSLDAKPYRLLSTNIYADNAFQSSVAPVPCDECITTIKVPGATNEYGFPKYEPVPQSVKPEYAEAADEWFLPCHQFVCDECQEITHYNNQKCQHCDLCSSCCSCTPYYKDRGFICECGDPDCDEQRPYSASYAQPQWLNRSALYPDVDTFDAKNARDNLYAQAGKVDPCQAMASFYLQDYIAAHDSGLTNEHYAFEPVLLAKEQQRNLVHSLDSVFMDYLFLAIGGEVRHHPNVGERRKERESYWSSWQTLGLIHGRTQMTRDAILLFEDYSAWGSSYGGEAWALIARILLMRLTGELDPKTFVDRVFTLQHHGGTVLNKVQWAVKNALDYLTPDCIRVGEYHSAEETRLDALQTLSDSPTAANFVRWWIARNRDRRDVGLPLLLRPEPKPVKRIRSDWQMQYGPKLPSTYNDVAGPSCPCPDCQKYYQTSPGGTF